ncbi:MAG: aminotransferase class III-fold pyridoxal phosphate-dependent enzyme [Spirochaetales bacterium]|nr:aminotransferase class III-fold pyridoxal phosphate-dependent enzyme [Spirochaetales bacterium]
MKKLIRKAFHYKLQGDVMQRQGIEHISTVWSHGTEILVDHAQGIHLYDEEGNRYIDFTSGIGVTNTGHCHPKVVAAIKAQAEKLIFGQFNIVYHQPVFDLVAELKQVVPPGLDSFFFASSGAEAVEAAVKLAKHATGRPNIIVFSGSFHGRTHLTMAMTTSKTVYRTHYQPLVGGIFVAPYPYSYYFGWDDETTKKFALKELKRVLKGQSAPDETAAIIIEPVLGEGGYVVPPAGFLAALRELCTEHGIMLIADEVQSGFGRTGKFFAVQHENVLPDIMTMAKGIASGVPLSGIAYKSELGKKWITGTHGGTYSGNTLACAAGAATVRAIREEGLDKNAAVQGERLMKGLKEIQKDFPVLGDVRGRGLMVATEFTSGGEPDAAIVKAIKKNAQDMGLLLLSCGTFDNIIRWIPPLVSKAEDIDEALSIFRKALEKAVK